LRTVELSNHPDAMLQERRELERQQSQRRYEEKKERVEVANRQMQDGFEARVAEHQTHLERLRAEHQGLRESWKWWSRRRAVARLRKAERETPRAPIPFAVPAPPSEQPNHRAPTDEEAKLTAGLEGEQLVADTLAEALGDEWTLLRGYRNGSGEIDQLLLGPTGLIAIEVKHRNATVFVKGDEWRFRKYDNYGNLVKEGRMTDRHDRSPSQQVKEAAAQLEGFLRRRGQELTIDPVVVLSHPNARIGQAEDLTVVVAYDPAYVIELTEAGDTRLEPARLPTIERLIVKDHEFHERRRQSRARSAKRSPE
jgi:exonuclease VII large subunit